MIQLRIICGTANKSYFHALSIQYFVLNRYSINKLSRSPAFLTTCNYKISYSKGACDVFKSPAVHLRGCDARPRKEEEKAEKLISVLLWRPRFSLSYFLKRQSS